MPTDAVIGLLWETTHNTRLPQYSVWRNGLILLSVAERSTVQRSLHAAYAYMG